jgi:hypothetical protein
MPSNNWKLQTRPLVKEGAPQQQTHNCLKIINERGKNWSRVPDGCLTPRQTGRLTIGHSMTLTLTWHQYMTPCGGRRVRTLPLQPCESVRGKRLFRHDIQTKSKQVPFWLLMESWFLRQLFVSINSASLFSSCCSLFWNKTSFYNRCCPRYRSGNRNTVNRLEFITIFWLHHRGDFYFNFIPAYPFVNPWHMSYLHAQFDSCPINVTGRYWNRVSEFCSGFSHLFIIITTTQWLASQIQAMHIQPKTLSSNCRIQLPD